MRSGSGKLDNIAFYIFLITVFLAPLAFWANKFVPLEMIKFLVISTGVIASAVLIAFVVLKERRISLPPASLCRTSTLLIISIIVSSILSLHFGKSFFGQAFEVGNASYLILMFLAGFVAFNLTQKQKDRAIVIYFAIVSSYIILFLLHVLRIIFGESFLSFGVLTSSTLTVFGNWYGLATFSFVVFIISIFAVLFLKLSRKMKIVFWVLTALSALSVIIVGDMRVWYVGAIVFLGLSIILFIEKWRVLRSTGATSMSRFWKALPLVPIITFLVFGLFIYRGASIVGPVVTKLKISHTEIRLPWQTTLDVTSSVIQNYPMFGVGSNNFSDAYQAYKPLLINSTEAWGTEFVYGFGLVPTFIASHGVLGSLLWILLFVFFGIIATKILKNLPSDAEKRFMLLSSFTISAFLWLLAFITVPGHAVLLLTFVITAIFVSLGISYGVINESVYSPAVGSKIYKLFASIVALVILILIVWGLVNIKKVIAFSYFIHGLSEYNTSQNLEKADMAFTTAIKFDNSDLYWRSKAEVAIATAQKLAGTINSSMSASTTQAVLTDINNVLNRGIADAKMATAYNPKNYYNYISEARVAEIAAGVKMPNGYENALKAYNSAIGLNPYNPSLYLNLANFEAKNSKYDDAIRDLGRALQVKNNYLDAVFLLSQVYSAKGDIQNAITAASVAVQLNPQNSVLLFQLGLLKYYAKDYAGSTQALEEAIKYQPDYANAKYFLGLSLARQNNTTKALAIFEELAEKNSDNQEIALIIANLRSGRSIFTDVKNPVTATPEKRAGLPVKEKK
jgi:tetratricopeptide (TPR) repeat protein